MYYVKSQNCNGSPGTAYTRRGLENMGEHLSADWHGLTIDGAIEWLKVKGTGSNQTWRREAALAVLASAGDNGSRKAIKAVIDWSEGRNR